MRSVCYAVGIKQCPSSRDAARRRRRRRCRRRRRRRLSVLLLAGSWLAGFGAVAAEAAFSGKRRKKAEVAARDSLSMCMYTRTACIYISRSIYVYMGYVRTEKIFWTCTSGGSCRIMLRRQLVWVLKMEWHRTGRSSSLFFAVADKGV